MALTSLTFTPARFLKYENILLRDYVTIAQSGNLRLLVLQGRPRERQITEAWEEIVRKNYEENADFGFDDYTELLTAYGYQLAEYNQVKAGLSLLLFMVDEDVIRFLKRAGYRIETTSHAAFVESIAKAMHTSENLATRLQLTYNEIERNYGEGAQKTRQVGFEEMIAVLSYQLGFAVDETITLSRYNEYKKVLKNVAKEKKKMERKEFD